VELGTALATCSEQGPFTMPPLPEQDLLLGCVSSASWLSRQTTHSVTTVPPESATAHDLGGGRAGSMGSLTCGPGTGPEFPGHTVGRSSPGGTHTPHCPSPRSDTGRACTRCRTCSPVRPPGTAVGGP
jgi:hypothetical protein